MILGQTALTQSVVTSTPVTTWTAIALTDGVGMGTVADLSVTTTQASYKASVSGTVYLPPGDKAGGYRLFLTIGGVKEAAPIASVDPRSTAQVSGFVPIAGSQLVTAAAGAKTLGLVAEYIGSAKVAAPLVFTVEELAGARRVVAPFTGTLAADQTNTDLVFGGMAGGFVATRAGSITGVSAQISAAITGAGTSATFKVTKNGTEIAGAGVAMTQAGGATTGYAVYAVDAYTFAAGDVIGVSYTSTTITNTPTASASVEIA